MSDAVGIALLFFFVLVAAIGILRLSRYGEKP